MTPPPTDSPSPEDLAILVVTLEQSLNHARSVIGFLAGPMTGRTDEERHLLHSIYAKDRREVLRDLDAAQGRLDAIRATVRRYREAREAFEKADRALRSVRGAGGDEEAMRALVAARSALDDAQRDLDAVVQ